MLFSDVDRTLLTHGYELRPEVCSAVEAARNAGIQIVLATARPPMAVRPYAAALKLTQTCICLNGAWVGSVDEDDGHSLGYLEPDIVERILGHALADGIDALLYTATAIYASTLTPRIETHSQRTGEIVTVIDGLNRIECPVLKVLCISTPEAAPVAFRGLMAIGGPTVSAAQSRDDLLEITSANVSKGFAAANVAHRLGLSHSECASIGDSENDLSLLAFSDLRMTVANATPAIKRMASLHFASCDAGGVAEALAYIKARNAAEAFGSAEIDK
ncbi:HAD-IIB family hydrolase [Caballeronia sp. LjRoot34]|uniref:HAD-IIB family hydrolase n=1 Tax=Caballeronia sp. LjRoot34 TaxID=3342325 RepID=UPI003ECE5A72